MEKEKTDREISTGILTLVKTLKDIIDQARTLAAVLTRSKPVIIEQPEDIHGALNASAYFLVEAENIDIYKWQYKQKASTTWRDSTLSTSNTNKLSITITQDRTGYDYRCKLTGIDGTVIYTIPVNVYVEEA